MVTLVISSLIGMIGGFTVYGILKESGVCGDSLVPVVGSFMGFIIVWAIAGLALKKIEKLDDE